ncbi:hypothetical protein AB1L88_18355 [Tautonia sp. JC769]|uniref:hypothetical protein n=1 Tax=Tautonia sp. JC769 TaxID=3232135 RepID=UPI00345803AE
MKAWLETLSRVLLDRSTEELFGAGLLCLVLAIVGAGLARWLCRSGRDVMARQTGVMLVMIVVAMIAGATLARSTLPGPARREHRPSEFPVMMGPSTLHQMVFILDTNGNGLVDPEELGAAALALGTQDRLVSESTSGPIDPDLPTPGMGAAGPGAPDDLVVPLDPQPPSADDAATGP